MSSSNNNFIATIVEQTGGNSKSAILSNDAPTIVEKFKSPAIRSESKVHGSRHFKSGGMNPIFTVKSETISKISGTNKSGLFSKTSKADVTSVAVKKYTKGGVDRFSDYVSPKAGKSDPVKSGEYTDVDEYVEEYEEESEPIMSEFGEPEFLPNLYLSDKQLESARGLMVGDKVYLVVEAEVSNFTFSENEEGDKRCDYNFKLKRGFVNKFDD